MTNEEKILKLSSLWYNLLIDHHKDRDCHFEIIKTYSYGYEISYTVQHFGYIYKEFHRNFDNQEDAEKWLINKLKIMIRYEAKRLMNCRDEYIQKKYGKKYFQNIINKSDEI